MCNLRPAQLTPPNVNPSSANLTEPEQSLMGEQHKMEVGSLAAGPGRDIKPYFLAPALATHEELQFGPFGGRARTR